MWIGGCPKYILGSWCLWVYSTCEVKSQARFIASIACVVRYLNTKPRHHNLSCCRDSCSKIVSHAQATLSMIYPGAQLEFLTPRAQNGVADLPESKKMWTTLEYDLTNVKGYMVYQLSVLNIGSMELDAETPFETFVGEYSGMPSLLQSLCNVLVHKRSWDLNVFQRGWNRHHKLFIDSTIKVLCCSVLIIHHYDKKRSGFW